MLYDIDTLWRIRDECLFDPTLIANDEEFKNDGQHRIYLDLPTKPLCPSLPPSLHTATVLHCLGREERSSYVVCSDAQSLTS